MLLIIDQAEELLVRSEDEKAASFLSLLCSALEAPNSPLLAVFTLRSDFLGDFQDGKTFGISHGTTFGDVIMVIAGVCRL